MEEWESGRMGERGTGSLADMKPSIRQPTDKFAKKTSNYRFSPTNGTNNRGIISFCSTAFSATWRFNIDFRFSSPHSPTLPFLLLHVLASWREFPFGVQIQKRHRDGGGSRTAERAVLASGFASQAS